MTHELEEMARKIALKVHEACSNDIESCEIYLDVLSSLREVRERTIKEAKESMVMEMRADLSNHEFSISISDFWDDLCGLLIRAGWRKVSHE